MLSRMPLPSDYRELPSPLDPRRIEALWTFVASSDGEHLVLPDGRMDLVARHRLDGVGRIAALDLLVAGPSSRAHRVEVAAGDRFLGLRFRAGWGGTCLGTEPASLRDRVLAGAEAEALLGSDAARLRGCATGGGLARGLLAVGRARAEASGGPGAGVERALTVLHLAGGRLGAAELARLAGLSERGLRRLLGAAVGLPPLALAAVLRFQRTMRLLATGRIGLAEAALEGGYADQAHMTREFRRLGGFTPARRPVVAFGSLPLPLAEIFKSEDAGRA